jgi:nucleotidyltransferase substrate binding protein (TIGR01987 family)
LDKFRKQLEDFEKSLIRLKEALKLAEENKNTELYPYFRDSAIQRFEFTFKIFWKLIKTALRLLEGLECNSPKSCMRALFKTEYIDESELKRLFEMVDDRNLTVHTYNEEIAEFIFGKLKNHAELMKTVVERIKGTLKRINLYS